MSKKKLDPLICSLIERCVKTNHRSFFMILGDHARDQVVILSHILSKATLRPNRNILWCYQKDLGFTSHRKSRAKQVQKKLKQGKMEAREDDPFEVFISSTNIRYTYYAETHKILGKTFGMCVLQDFESLTPNLLARTIETVEGGGIVVLLVRGVTSLKQISTLTMDAHARYRTESHQDIVPRFNERLVLSLKKCQNCIIMTDQLDVINKPNEGFRRPLPSKPLEAQSSKEDEELEQLRNMFDDKPHIFAILKCCKTNDQAQAVIKFIDALADYRDDNKPSTVTMTAARGRGKSAALGLAMAFAIAAEYSSIYVTAPSPENLKTMFEFVCKGFDALAYEENTDYDIVQSSNADFNKAVVRVTVHQKQRQRLQHIQYIHPSDAAKLGHNVDLLCIDEAAAIPLPIVKKLIGPHLVFMCSTINGYEGTGRSLSLKLIDTLRRQADGKASKEEEAGGKGKGYEAISKQARPFAEVTLRESIRYAVGDPVEKWLNDVLCLDATESIKRVSSGLPDPRNCELYYVNRDSLFSYHPASEDFLQRIVSIYVSAHYKNSPNDLQMLSDAPAHNIFTLLGPVDHSSNALPEILCVVQVCLEGQISKQTILNSLSRGKQAAGDLIPWTLSQQFNDENFPQLSGARIVRIATHPDYQKSGYGTRTMELLQQYYEGKMASVMEETTEVLTEVNTVNDEDLDNMKDGKPLPKKKLPTLLLKLTEKPAERLDYIGTSFGLTPDLLKFWKKSNLLPVYLGQRANELTGEHTCIMVKRLKADEEAEEGIDTWLDHYNRFFQISFMSLCHSAFSPFSTKLALNVLKTSGVTTAQPWTYEQLQLLLSANDMENLHRYAKIRDRDYHTVTYLLPNLATLYFRRHIKTCFGVVQQAILLGMGFQNKTVEQMAEELALLDTQILGFFMRMMRIIYDVLYALQLEHEMASIPDDEAAAAVPMDVDSSLKPLDEVLSAEAKKAVKKQKKKEQQSMERFTIKDGSNNGNDGGVGGIETTVSFKDKKKRKAELSVNEHKKKKKSQQ